MIGSVMRLLGLIAITCTISWATAASAQPLDHQGQPYVQKNWAPNVYTMFCGAFPDTPRTTNCFPASVAQSLATATSRAVGVIKTFGFRPPKVLGFVKDGKVRFYDSGEPGIAMANAVCNRGSMSIITVGTDIIPWAASKHISSYLLGHEIAHAVQGSYPLYKKKRCDLNQGWLFEGTADAISLHAVRSMYPNLFPASASDREARKFSGLRRYDLPLNYEVFKKDKFITTGEPIYYLTSSFFRHIAEVYHGGLYKYLHSYFIVSPNDSLLDWLNNRLLADPNVKMPLALVYALFVGDFAGWGDSGFPGEHFGRERWLRDAFGLCETVSLSPASPTASKTRYMHSAASRCLRVEVGGLTANDRVAVKVTAFPKGKRAQAIADELHLVRAFSEDQADFNCAKERELDGFLGLARCGFIPQTGTLKTQAGVRHMRTWTANTQYPRAGAIKNTYIMSRFPHKLKDGRQRRENIEVVFTLDVTTMTGKAKPKSKSVSHTQGGATGAQESLPSKNNTSQPQAPGMGILSNMPAANLSTIMPNVAPPSLPPNKIGYLYISEVNVLEEEYGYETIDEEATYQLQLLTKRGGSYAPHSIAPGTTGTFPILVSGGEQSAPYFTHEPGTLRIERFDDLSLRATYSARLCSAIGVTRQNPCPRPRTISGSLVKAFPVAHLPAFAFKEKNTPGMKMYRDVKARVFKARGGPAKMAEAARKQLQKNRAAKAQSAGTQPTPTSCKCTCNEFKELQKEAERLLSTGQQNKAIEHMKTFSTCTQQCMQQYSQCGP